MFGIRETFEVIAKPGTSNVAYLSGPLQLHTDLPYYEYKPGVSIYMLQSSVLYISIMKNGISVNNYLKRSCVNSKKKVFWSMSYIY